MIGPPPGAGWFARRTVTGLAGALRAGTTSPADLVERSLAEAARLDPGLNALAAVDAPGARAAAERAGRELSQGLDRGPLHGIPVAVKDVVDTAGLRTAMGSRHHAGPRARARRGVRAPAARVRRDHRREGGDARVRVRPHR
ncbi:amidase family protein [Actinomadura madurae]|uniref:amidase family protein n=1 Tax=Actinomadura madurae TaxID=1993 RepID=UPI0020D21A26|nr:amidase family protein [Actinomadura madurae]